MVGDVAKCYASVPAASSVAAVRCAAVVLASIRSAAAGEEYRMTLHTLNSSIASTRRRTAGHDDSPNVGTDK